MELGVVSSLFLPFQSDVAFDIYGWRCVSGSALQSVVMACLCSTLKLQTADRLPYSVPTLLSHITNNKMSLDRVLRVRWENATLSVSKGLYSGLVQVAWVECIRIADLMYPES